MDSGCLAHMTPNKFISHDRMPMPPGGLALRRGSQNIKPLSFDNFGQGSNAPRDSGLATPRTSRSHLLAGLRTAPKSASAVPYGTASPTSAAFAPQYARTNMADSIHGYGQESLYTAPHTAFAQYGVQQSGFPGIASQQQYTVDQVLAPPEIAADEQAQDPNLYAHLVATNMYLAQQQQQLQQQLRNVQAAAQQFQQLNLNSPHLTQQQMAIYEQQQQLRNLQQQLTVQAAMGQGQQVYYSPVTGQYYVDSSAAAQATPRYAEQPLSPGFYRQQQQQQQQQQYHQQLLHHQQQGTPHVQVSPPHESLHPMVRSISPVKGYESSSDVAPLPPTSANAFRRGHNKSSSLALNSSALAAAGGSGEVPGSAAAKSPSFPMTPVTGSYGPGQARAGEHPIRQPRGPPALDELKSKPTAKHEGSKNFASRTRRSAVHNLVRAGLERRKGSGSSTGSVSPVSETADESPSPITDNDSDSGRSGSGSLAGEMECGSSRTSASGTWGAIGSDRPSSRQKAHGSADSTGTDSCTPACQGDNNSFADVFKNGGGLRASKAQEPADSHRKASRLVLTSAAEKRKASPLA